MSGTVGSRLRHVVGEEAATIRWWSVLVAVELAVVAAYAATEHVVVTEARYAVYPFVWINVGLWAVVRTDTRSVDRRQRGVAAAFACGYLLVLCVAGGILQFSPTGALPGGGATVHWVLPGWGPILTYGNGWVGVAFVPFKFVGYASMTYLVYARLLDATRAVLSGALGLVSCVGCTFSVLLPLVGASALFGSELTALSWDLSTAVFLLTVALLYYADEVELALRRRLAALR